MRLNLVPAFAAAILTPPIGAVIGMTYLIATRFSDDYAWELSNNAHVRELGHPAPDPGPLQFLGESVLHALPMVMIGSIVILIVNLVAGIPTLLVSDRLFRSSTLLRIAVPVLAGIGLGGYIWGPLTAPALPINLQRFAEGAVFGGTAALAVALVYHRLAKETEIG